MRKYRRLSVVGLTIACMLGLSACGTEDHSEQVEDTTEESGTGDGGDEQADLEDEETRRKMRAKTTTK